MKAANRRCRRARDWWRARVRRRGRRQIAGFPHEPPFVVVDADGVVAHAGEGGEALLLVVTVARGPVAVGADDEGLQAFLL